MSHAPLSVYRCPVCSARVTAKRLTQIWCQCLPSTPTSMVDEALERSIQRAIGVTVLPSVKP